MVLLPAFALLLIAAAAAYAVPGARAVRLSALAAGFVVGGGTCAHALLALAGRADAPLGGLWHADAFAWLLAALIGFLYACAAAVSFRYIGREYHEGALALPQVRLYFFLLPLFIVSMLASVFADNLGVLWMGLEGTTLATTMLVALYRKDASVEAAWKYILLCSIGIGLGLFGLLLFAAAAVRGGLTPEEALSLDTLRRHAAQLDAQTVRWAFVFILVGLGTKVGFVPMHTWLPDAHGKTPSPISALLSGILLNVALAALVRFKTVTDLVLDGSAWTDRLFLVFGTLSVVVAAFLLLQQRNYKRMLAYSSVEHMGLIAVLVGFGPAGAAAAVLHMVGHALAKSLLFFASGELLLAYGTTKIEGVRGALRRLPLSAGLFLTGTLLVVAAPPSLLFTSELLGVAAGMRAHPAVTLAVLAALATIAFSMLRHVLAMLFGQEAERARTPEPWNAANATMALLAAVALALGAWAVHPGALRFAERVAASFTVPV